jgi:phosphotriesterase-related protein
MEVPVTKKVQTVLGPIAPEQLGVTLTHEHLLIDLSFVRPVPEEALAREVYYAPLSMETLSQVRAQGMASMDDLRLLDVETAIAEAMLYKQHGGSSLVDATSIGIARDPAALARISRETGLNIVMGSSYYVAPSHPADMDSRSEESIMEQIVQDITVGVDDTGVRSGIIGEVGCSWPLTNNERKVLRASAVAQSITGAPLLIHPGRDESSPLEIIAILHESGADLRRTIMGHLDRTVYDRGILREIAATGCYLEWDLFGNEASYYPFNAVVDMPNDSMRIDTIAWIASEGFGDRVLVAHDVCKKHQLSRWGGHGYSYIPAHIVPRMRARGYSDDLIDAILVDNPAAVLTFVAPQAG